MSDRPTEGAVVVDSEALRESIITNSARHQFLSAGAGAGKTTVLVDHYFHLLSNGCRPSQLVAVTFTEKAASEMKSRLREKCRARARQARQDRPTEGPDWESLLHEVEVAPISTIHGLCARLLKENALVAGLDPDFAVLDEADSGMLLDEAVRQTLLSRLGQADSADILAVALGYEAAVGNLTTLVKDRVKIETVLADARYADPGALLKYWAEMARKRLEELVRACLQGDEWREACAIVTAPQEKPADCKLNAKRALVAEALHRHGAALDPPCSEAEACATAFLELAEEMLALKPAGGAGSVKVWSEDDLAAMRGALRIFLNREGLLQTTAAECRPLLTQTAEEAACAELTCALVAEVKAAREAYTAAKNDRSALDFEDLIERTHRLWQEHTEALTRTSRALKHVMIDEFQDTNTLQKQVLWPLVTGKACERDHAEALPEEGARLFVVGDAKQSIYRFRNADVTVFNTTRQEMARDGARNDELTRNFRSTDGLIGVFNSLFASSAVMGTEVAETYQASYARMQAVREEPPLGQAPLEVHLLTDFKASAGEELAEGDEDRSVAGLREKEATWLAQRLVHLIHSGEYQVLHGKGASAVWESVKPGDIAILFRAMRDVRLYERALRAAGLPYYLVVGQGFFRAQEVQDVVHVLRAIENGLDDIALVGSLRSPMFGLSDETLYWLGRMGSGAWWWRVQNAAKAQPEEQYREVCARITGGQRQRLERAATLLEDLRRNKNRVSLAALVQSVLDRTGFAAVLAAQFGGNQMVSNVRKLVELAGEFEAERQADGQASLRDFVEHLRRLTAELIREGQAPVEEEAGNAIKLITYHSAKGLQWPVVVAPDLCRKPGGGGFGPPYRFHRDLGLVVNTTRLIKQGNESSFSPPLGGMIKKLNDAEEEAESRRLFYVAATRAQDLLILSGVTLLSKDAAVHADARKGALGWTNAALGGVLWAEEGNEPAQRLWRWEGGTLAPQDGLCTSEALYASREGEDAALETLDRQALARRVANLPAVADGQRRFTATELSLYHHCPRLYELERRLGLPGAQPSLGGEAAACSLSPMEFGTVVHRVLQLVGTGGQSELDRLVPAGARMLHLDTLLDKRAAEAAGSIRQQVQHFLDHELYQTLFRGDSALRSEVGLAVPVMIGGQSVLVEGKIDALIQTADGQRHLLDYKTGREDRAKQTQYRVQLGLYCYAVQQATGMLPASASLVYLSGDEVNHVELEVEATTREALAAATEAIVGIWRGDFAERTEECRYCVGRGLCQPEPEIEDEVGQDE